MWTSGRTRGRWGCPNLLSITSAGPDPAGETVEIEVSGPLVATTAESWVISGQILTPAGSLLFVPPKGVAKETSLRNWVAEALEFVKTLPPKKKEKKR